MITPETPIWCPACRAHHPAAEFPKNVSKPSGLQGECRRAVRERAAAPRAREAVNRARREKWKRPEVRAAALERQRGRRERLGAGHDLGRSRARLQAVVTEWKAGGCVDCGYADVRALDPDHIDPEQKAGTISRLVQLCIAKERLLSELAKCEVRCARCHRARTMRQRPRAGGPLPPSWARVVEFQARNDRLKLARGCADCGWSEWARGLDWDHVRGVKAANVAQLIVERRPWSEVAAEIAKCEVVCANCHRIRTADRRARTPRVAARGADVTDGGGGRS
ncbi:hypothetical protein ACFC1T_17435 [Kitasatospora sp. NPDC056076]|uniref:hypothetical protein n=1 Tax=Kitasatospora sp. NPDC056076 TaxID=3345703 RepID=UPI0035DAA428